MPSPSATSEDSAPLYPPTVTPPPAPLGLIRYFLTFVRNPLRVMPEAVYRDPIVQYGDRLTWVTDPSLVKTILLEDRDNFPKTRLEKRALGPLLGKGILNADGPEWRWQRQLAAPLFRHADILRYAPAMVCSAEDMIRQWRARPPGTAHRVDEDMTHATFRVIADTMLQGGDPSLGAALERLNQDYLLPISWPVAYAVLGLPASLAYPGRRARRDAERRMRATVGAIVRARRDNPGERDDLLVCLLRAKDPDSGQPMAEDQLVDNLLTFLVAGHETTAKALTWALYLLARSPAWERRLLDEIDRIAGAGPIRPEHIDRLTEVGQFIKETMRLYPPIPSLTRTIKQDVVLAGKRLAARSLIIIPIFAIHRHRRLWDDPDRFDPDRLAPERETQYSRYQFMPFGAGPRVCIGGSFAMVETITMLASFVRAARFKAPAGHVPTPISRITLLPRGGMPLEVWPRADRAVLPA
jgi:cytochrome P450